MASIPFLFYNKYENKNAYGCFLVYFVIDYCIKTHSHLYKKLFSMQNLLQTIILEAFLLNNKIETNYS